MDEPGTFIFEWCCQRCGPRPRTDQQPAPPSGPSPVGSHLVSRGGRAPFDRGDPAVMPKFLSARRRALLGQGIAVAGAMTAGAAGTLTGAAAEPLKDEAWSLEFGSIMLAA
jgi:hypothetical protein